MSIFVLVAIWIVIGLLVGLAASSMWKEDRPYGEAGDYLIAIVVSVLTGLVDWYVLPQLGIEGTLKFIAAVIEPPVVALLVLWAIRRFKKR